jgi:voltage-gated sodium channel
MEDGARPAGAYARLRRLTESDAFESVIATLLLLNGGALLLESFADVSEFDLYLWIFFAVSQTVFVVEIALRVASYGPRFLEFFRDGWNVFDFVVVALSLAPEIGALSFGARIVRVLRVLRFLRVLRLASLYFRRTGREAR